MRTMIAVVVGALLVANVAAADSKSNDDKPGKKRAKTERGAVVRTDSGSRVDVHITFSSHDVRLIREYYAPRYRNLPPGLQKKLARTGKLPPGWQKKMEPFPPTLERDLVVLPQGYRRGVIDGHAVIYLPKTQVIFDVAVLF